MELAVLIPALDEEEALPWVLEDLRCWGSPRVVVVDNGSRDRTPEIALSMGAELVREPRRGYGRACLSGLQHLAQDPPDWICFLDGDHSDYVEDLDRLLLPLRAGRADMVLGDRTQLAEAGALMPQQVLGNHLATSLIWLATGQRYRDMGPFRVLRWGALSSLEMQDPDYGWNVEMQMKAALRGLRVEEVPVRYRPRRGQSKISGTVRGSVRAGVKILRATRRHWP